MTKERKEQIIDNYIKDIKLYLNVGLCEGQANGSFGEDLMRHFDIIAEHFKETILIEHDLDIDLIILFNALQNGVYYRMNSGQITKDYVWLIDNNISIGTRKKLSYSFMTAFGRQTLLFNEYGKTWALTKEELSNGNS